MTNEHANTDAKEMPKHVAIIPDGNRRWAKERGLPEYLGHKKGAEVITKVLETGRELGIHTMTVWGLSTENWNRSKEEIDYLMQLFMKLFDENAKKAKKENAKIVHLGRKDRIPTELRDKIIKVEEETKHNTSHVLNIGLDYGGQDELLRAMGRALEDVQKGKISIKELEASTDLFKNYLDTGDQPHPYPDLVIRTSGEQRLSGFLSWQCAYAELYFPKVHFPDFDKEEFKKAIEIFTTRNRRFGGN